MRDIKITYMYFKEGQLDTTPMTIIDVNMQSALVIDQSRFLMNTSMVAGKSLQAIENKIDKLNKKIDNIRNIAPLKIKQWLGCRTKINTYLQSLIRKGQNLKRASQK